MRREEVALTADVGIRNILDGCLGELNDIKPDILAIRGLAAPPEMYDPQYGAFADLKGFGSWVTVKLM